MQFCHSDGNGSFIPFFFLLKTHETEKASSRIYNKILSIAKRCSNCIYYSSVLVYLNVFPWWVLDDSRWVSWCDIQKPGRLYGWYFGVDSQDELLPTKLIRGWDPRKKSLALSTWSIHFRWLIYWYIWISYRYTVCVRLCKHLILPLVITNAF